MAANCTTLAINQWSMRRMELLFVRMRAGERFGVRVECAVSVTVMGNVGKVDESAQKCRVMFAVVRDCVY